MTTETPDIDFSRLPASAAAEQERLESLERIVANYEKEEIARLQDELRKIRAVIAEAKTEIEIMRRVLLACMAPEITPLTYDEELSITGGVAVTDAIAPLPANERPSDEIIRDQLAAALRADDDPRGRLSSELAVHVGLAHAAIAAFHLRHLAEEGRAERLEPEPGKNVLRWRRPQQQEERGFDPADL